MHILKPWLKLWMIKLLFNFQILKRKIIISIIRFKPTYIELNSYVNIQWKFQIHKTIKPLNFYKIRKIHFC